MFLLIVGAFPSVASAQVTIDLYQCVDSTGSLSTTQYANQVNGLSAALPSIFTAQTLANANIRFTMIRLRGPGNGQSDIIFQPRVMDDIQDVTDAQNALAGTLPRQNAGGTCVLAANNSQDCCIDIAQSLFSGVDGDPLRILDLTTDGLPNQGVENGNTINTFAMNAGFDSVNAVAIDNGNGGLQFLENVTDDFGFTIPINVNSSVESYEEAFEMKIESEITTGCCLADNMCTEGNVESECIGLGGVFEADTTCQQGCTPQPVGCCLNQNTNMCEPNVLQNECAGIFGADTPCGQGVCTLDPVGCCLNENTNMCEGSVRQSQCTGVFAADTDCGTGACTPEPVGCCLNENTNMCEGSVRQSQCTGVFAADTDCGTGACTPEAVGCCLNETTNMCEGDVRQSQCTGVFAADTSCGTGACTPEPVGCCLNETTNMCEGAVRQSQCTGVFAADTSCGTGACTPEAVGCCLNETTNMCEGDVRQSQCTGVFAADTSCGTGACTPEPVGCCLNEDTNMCEGDVRQSQCSGVFAADTSCGTGACTPEPVGCCLDENANMCTPDVRESQCSGVFAADTSCGTGACTPEPVGCCLDENANMCTPDVRESQCSGVFAADTACGVGVCTPEPEGCCLTDNMCSGDVVESTCLARGGEFEADTSCSEGCFPTGCCDMIDGGSSCIDGDGVTQNECNTLGGNFIVGDTCNIINTCGDPLVTHGCCIIQGECNDLTNVECAQQGGEYTPGQLCNLEGTCGFLPEGCCICGQAECTIVSEGLCADMGEDCEFREDSTCRDIDECSNAPGCCFLDDGPQGESIATRGVNPNECLELPATECQEIGGGFQGPGTLCIDFPEECFYPMRNIPTLSQWGLMAMAGLLGLFSLLVIARRNKLNLNLR